MRVINQMKKIKKIIKKIINIFPNKNIILFESYPDFADSTKLFFDYLIEKN